MIKETYTITESNASYFNTQVKKVIYDLQSDNLEVEVKFSTSSKLHGTLSGNTIYSAMIIGREK